MRDGYPASPRLFSPPLFLVASPRLSLAREAPGGVHLVLDAGPALQLVAGPGGALRAGGDVHASVVQPIRQRLRLAAEVRAERFGRQARSPRASHPSRWCSDARDTRRPSPRAPRRSRRASGLSVKQDATVPGNNSNNVLLASTMVWAVPRSLAATSGITLVFCSCRY